MSSKCSQKIAESTSKYLSTFIIDLTILFLAKVIETGSEIVLVFVNP